MTGRAEARDWARERARGLWASLTMPFNEDGTINESGLRHNVRWCLSLGMEGIGWGALGEPWSLSHEERKRGLEVVLDEVKDRIPVYSYATDHSIIETVRLAEHARDVGAALVMVNPPYEHAKSEAMILGYLEYLGEHVDVALILNNTPLSGFIMSPDFITRIVDNVQGVCALKNDKEDIAHSIAIQQLVGDKIVVSHTFEPEWYNSLVNLGMQVLLGIPSLYLMQTPKNPLIRRYTDAALSGDYHRAKELRDSLEPIRKAMKRTFAGLWRENRYPYGAVKYWQDLLGMCGGDPRPPAGPLTEVEKIELRRELEEAGLIHRGC